MGPEIRVDGVRPEWLRDDDRLQWFGADYAPDWQTGSDSVFPEPAGKRWFWHDITAIRLPADHPHYATLSRATAPNGGEVGPEVERLPDGFRPIAELLEFIRTLAARDDSIGDDARALLSEPVDGDLIAARESVAEMKLFRHVAHQILAGSWDDLGIITATRDAIRTRALEKEAGR